MAVRLSAVAFKHAKELVALGHYIYDDRDAWSEHRPTAQQENEFIRQHGFEEYAKWYQSISDEKPEHTKGRYEFPYGDFENVHRCGCIECRKQGRSVQTLRH